MGIRFFFPVCKVIAGSDDSLDYRQPTVQDAVGFMTGVRGVGAGTVRI